MSDALLDAVWSAEQAGREQIQEEVLLLPSWKFGCHVMDHMPLSNQR